MELLLKGKASRQIRWAIRRGQNSRGFTMLEFLLMATILGVLASLSFAAVSKAMGMAFSARESSAGRALITAYFSAASDNNGFFIPGYAENAVATQLPDGTAISKLMTKRYPYRLAPYFNYDFKGTLLTSDNAEKFAATNYYNISAFPSFGINYIFVGGEVTASGSISYRSECLQMAGKGRGHPVLVFATAGGPYGADGSADSTIQGYFKIRAPHDPKEGAWTSELWTADAQAMNYGQVDARHEGKAICVFSDGSIKKLTMEEMRDMRLWSFRAAEANDPDYVVRSNK